MSTIGDLRARSGKRHRHIEWSKPVERLTNALSVSELNQEVARLGLYTEDDQ
jgi:hypothetical protein